MKPTSAFLILLSLFLTGCELINFDFKGNLTDGFCLVSGDEVKLNHHDIDYYDYSSHLIYLKNNKTFGENLESPGAFSVFAGRDEIYKVHTVPGYSSFMPSGPVVFTHPLPYGEHIISIGFIHFYDTLGNLRPDPREDDRIVRALKKHGQFRAGLSCEIKSVRYLSPENVKVELLLKNNDAVGYYFLDPGKMGDGLFHYFTNGLSIRDFKGQKFYTHRTKAIQPQPWNSWKSDWLSVIHGNESKAITITYNDFEVVTPGNYKATFVYPGLAYQVKKEDIMQENGRIWLGSIETVKDVVIE